MSAGQVQTIVVLVVGVGGIAYGWWSLTASFAVGVARVEVEDGETLGCQAFLLLDFAEVFEHDGLFESHFLDEALVTVDPEAFRAVVCFDLVQAFLELDALLFVCGFHGRRKGSWGRFALHC